MTRRIATLILVTMLLAAQAIAQAAPAATPATATPATAAPATAAPAAATPAAATPAAATPAAATPTIRPVGPTVPVILPYGRKFPLLPQPVVLTPDKAACLAVQRSTDLAVAKQGVASACGYLKQAEALNKLTATLTASLTRIGPGASAQLPGSDVAITFQPNNTHVESLTATLPLYLSGRDRFSRQVATANVQAATDNVGSGILNVAFAARQAFYTLLRLEHLAVVAQQKATALAEHLRITNSMFAEGTAPRFEVVQAETDLASAQGSVITALTAVAQSKASLASLLNMPQGEDFKLEEGVPAVMPEGDVYKMIETSMNQRPELQVRLAQIRAQEANVRLARAANDPELALSATVTNQTPTVATVGQGYSLTLGLTWPFAQGGADKGQVQVAQAALQTAKLNLEASSQQIALQVVQAEVQVEDAREALIVAEKGEVNATERARIAEVRFMNGVGLGVEVLDAQTSLAQAQTQTINARYELQTAIAALRAAIGLSDLPADCCPQG